VVDEALQELCGAIRSAAGAILVERADRRILALSTGQLDCKILSQVQIKIEKRMLAYPLVRSGVLRCPALGSA